MTDKTLTTLVDDIYHLFNPEHPHQCNEENLDRLAEDIKALVRTRLGLSEYKGGLRISGLGKQDRQVWYDNHPDPMHPPEPLTPKTFFKFLYGDVLEQLILFLAREAGHSVTRQQEEIDVDGVKGHIDAVIDGVVVDVKSASAFGYQKFEQGTILKEDPFGYVQQLSGYASVLTPGQDAAWIAFDKVHGDICVTWLPHSVIAQHPPGARVAALRGVLNQPEPPERCFSPVPDGKSGNMKLGTECSYCAHKFRCWPGLTAFYYASGPRYLTTVVRQPKVPDFPE